MFKIRKAKGFTLIELLVVVVIIGILAAIALPNFIGAQKKAKISSVKANMHTCQLCSESYGTDAGGVYSSVGTGLGPYYPGGNNSVGGTSGTLPTNPFTAVTNEPLATSSCNTVQAIITARTTTTAANEGAQTGQTGYVGFSDTGGTVTTSYSVVGGDDNGKDPMGVGGMMVLSNQ